MIVESISTAYRPEGTSSQISVLLYDQHHRACAAQISFSRDANSSVLVHLLQIMWSHNFYVQLATKVLLQKLQTSSDFVQFSSVITYLICVLLLSKLEFVIFYVHGSVHHNIFYEITNRCSYMQSILFHC